MARQHLCCLVEVLIDLYDLQAHFNWWMCVSCLVVCRMIKLGLSIDEDDVVGEDADEDLPPLEENVDEGSRMEEVD